ncbi:hypothetical protein E2C01_020879 [Portunus trituberculatus]|uniref:Uncharacterized protein n=1 Tax=Portunus trituberculatus TaxID=210409 RepID=A0A5B7E1C6_PORTR|nr:hypothetical protein [Portunus trituberculatus]
MLPLPQHLAPLPSTSQHSPTLIHALPTRPYPSSPTPTTPPASHLRYCPPTRHFPLPPLHPFPSVTLFQRLPPSLLPIPTSSLISPPPQAVHRSGIETFMSKQL